MLKITMGMNSFSSNIPIIGMISSNVAIETVKMRYRKEANEKMPLVVKKLVNTRKNVGHKVSDRVLYIGTQ